LKNLSFLRTILYAQFNKKKNTITTDKEKTGPDEKKRLEGKARRKG
jgi:hypothetical protein